MLVSNLPVAGNPYAVVAHALQLEEYCVVHGFCVALIAVNVGYSVLYFVVHM